jgi:DnaJ-class molecular chaperone
MSKSDYYKILGVEKNSSEKEIKEAWHKLALKYHPDLHITPEGKKKAEEKMSEINKAYQVLSDKSKRRDYDRFGDENASSRQKSYYYGNDREDSEHYSSFFNDVFDNIFEKKGGFQ